MIKEEIQLGDILVSSRHGNTIFAKVIGEGTNSFGVIINGEKDSIMFTQLRHWRKFENPIKDNRIVSNKTFAIRFKSFIENTNVHDCASEEEKEYLIYVADSLLQYQIQTATNEEEINYLKRLNLYDN